jgi:hypothetical protein
MVPRYALWVFQANWLHFRQGPGRLGRLSSLRQHPADRVAVGPDTSLVTPLIRRLGQNNTADTAIILDSAARQDLNYLPI